MMYPHRDYTARIVRVDIRYRLESVIQDAKKWNKMVARACYPSISNAPRHSFVAMAEQPAALARSGNTVSAERRPQRTSTQQGADVR